MQVELYNGHKTVIVVVIVCTECLMVHSVISVQHWLVTDM